jgi:ankyrin repeat protein
MSAAELFEAIRAGDAAAVGAMLNASPSLANAKNDAGVSAVLMSIYSGRREIRDLLLAQEPALELHDAAAVGNLDRVRLLVEKDPSLAQAFSPDGFPVVALAAVFGHHEILRFLFEHGADISAPATNGSGYNALTGAVAGGHTEIVKWLLEHGANPNYRYSAGYSPLLTAAANGHLGILRLLIEHGADASADTNDGKSALTLATERNHLEVAAYLHSL